MNNVDSVANVAIREIMRSGRNEDKKKMMFEDTYTYDEKLAKVVWILNNLIKTNAG